MTLNKLKNKLDMKFLLTGLLAILTIVSYSQNNDDLLDNIASDSLYHAYMKNIEERLLLENMICHSYISY